MCQSQNLKPAGSAKPNLRGPPTNPKIAAILEKANTIRKVGPLIGLQKNHRNLFSTLFLFPSFWFYVLIQACVGSDDDDEDGHDWSDS